MGIGIPGQVHWTFMREIYKCQKPPIIDVMKIEDFQDAQKSLIFDRWHACSIANLIQVVFEHARKYVIFQNRILDLVHRL